MPGKEIGFGWTNVLTWLRWGSNTSLMHFALTRKGPGEQLHAKHWAFPPARFQRIPILNRCMRTSSRLLQGASRLKGRHLRPSVKSIRTWLRKGIAYRMLRVGGQGCRTTPPRTSFSGTDESVLLRFAKVSERMWVALFLGSFACVFPTREGSVGSFWRVSRMRKVPSPLRLRSLCFSNCSVSEFFP